MPVQESHWKAKLFSLVRQMAQKSQGLQHFVTQLMQKVCPWKALLSPSPDTGTGKIGMIIHSLIALTMSPLEGGRKIPPLGHPEK